MIQVVAFLWNSGRFQRYSCFFGKLEPENPQQIDRAMIHGIGARLMPSLEGSPGLLYSLGPPKWPFEAQKIMREQ